MMNLGILVILLLVAYCIGYVTGFNNLESLYNILSDLENKKLQEELNERLRNGSIRKDKDNL